MPNICGISPYLVPGAGKETAWGPGVDEAELGRIPLGCDFLTSMAARITPTPSILLELFVDRICRSDWADVEKSVLLVVTARSGSTMEYFQLLEWRIVMINPERREGRDRYKPQTLPSQCAK